MKRRRRNASSSDRTGLLLLREMSLEVPLSFFYRNVFDFFISLFVIRLSLERTVRDSCVCLCVCVCVCCVTT